MKPIALIHLACLLLSSGVGPAWGQTLIQTNYMGFQVPPGWDCQKDGADIVCQPEDPALSRQAILVVSAKQVSAEENLDFLKRRLLEPRATAIRTGSAPQRSEVTAHTVLELGGVEWVDATHFASEIPQFNTRYVATSARGLSVLLSFSAHSSQWEAYNLHFQSVLSSIRLPPLEVWSDLALAEVTASGALSEGGFQSLNLSGLEAQSKSGTTEGLSSWLPWIILGLLFLGAFALWFWPQGQKNKKRRRSRG